MRQFVVTLHVPWLSNLFVITCKYGLQDIDTVIIDRTSDFWKEHKSTIDYPICFRDDFEWTTTEFRGWSATRDPCFIIDLLVLDPLNLHLPVDILRDYALKFEVKVESTLRDLRECLVKAIRDRDYCKEILDAIMEDFDEMGRTYMVELTHFM